MTGVSFCPYPPQNNQQNYIPGRPTTHATTLAIKKPAAFSGATYRRSEDLLATQCVTNLMNNRFLLSRNLSILARYTFHSKSRRYDNLPGHKNEIKECHDSLITPSVGPSSTPSFSRTKRFRTENREVRQR